MLYDVLISGGGPVGLGLAIELGQRGHSVCVVERNLAPPPIPKGQNLTQRTMEHMAHWGCEAEIRAAKTIPAGVGMGGLTAYGTLLSGYHYDWFRRAVVDEYYNTCNERLPQYATEEVLRARAAALPSVTCHFGWSTREIAQTGETTRLVATRDDETIEARGRYLVGCDGARSLVRRQSGLTETRDDHDRPMALVVFTSPEFFDLVKPFKDKQFYNVLHSDNDGYWMFFGMVEWQKSFFFHAPVPRGTDRDTFDFKGYIQRAVGRAFEMELDYVGFWDLRISLADDYRAGRVFIAGDAAHSHPPYGGYGINTGFEDARNLGWKLSAMLDGWGSDALLDSYAEERCAVFASTARDFIANFIEEDRAFLRAYHPDRDREGFEAAWARRAQGGDADGIGAFAPHYSGSSCVTGGVGESSAKGTHDHRARPGHHLPPCPLGDGRTVTDALGPRLTLLASDEIAVEGPVDLVPMTGEAAERLGARFVLARPDGFVAWAGDDAMSLPEAISRALGAIR